MEAHSRVGACESRYSKKEMKVYYHLPVILQVGEAAEITCLIAYIAFVRIGKEGLSQTCVPATCSDGPIDGDQK